MKAVEKSSSSADTLAVSEFFAASSISAASEQTTVPAKYDAAPRSLCAWCETDSKSDWVKAPLSLPTWTGTSKRHASKTALPVDAPSEGRPLAGWLLGAAALLALPLALDLARKRGKARPAWLEGA